MLSFSLLWVYKVWLKIVNVVTVIFGLLAHLHEKEHAHEQYISQNQTCMNSTFIYIICSHEEYSKCLDTIEELN